MDEDDAIVMSNLIKVHELLSLYIGLFKGVTLALDVLVLIDF